MSTVKLHFRPDATAAACAVCRVRLTRGELDRWWLCNTWTHKRGDYHEGAGNWPGDWLVPCGKLEEPRK